ncbi:AAA domain-containing protein [Peribacillus kribbensis]|uniref:AAA domain-containing protein n=1 Tax=Peribacillus kribbensis TaxID=356658 RepID=UPI000401A28A|nr:AAA domain-containing protein [Peribacillus kribbensis]
MTSTLKYIAEWQDALSAEIYHLKKYGSTKYYLKNGHLAASSDTYSYFFESGENIRIPNGTEVRFEWQGTSEEGRILSSEGRGVIISFTRHIGDLIPEGFLYHDPWKLLDELSSRLDEMKTSKRKRKRIKSLMEPSGESLHPKETKSSLHELILRSKYNSATFVWGPPGTGKTYTLARVAANKYKKKQRVLILSHSNQAVDVLMNEVYSFLEKKDMFHEGDILRFGSQSAELAQSIATAALLEKQFPELAQDKWQLTEERRLLKQDLIGSYSQRDSGRLLEIETKIARVLEKIRQKEVQFMKDADIIGTTLAKAATDPAIYENEYDLVIVDEISQAYIPQAAFAASLGKRVIVCGDFKQLPPIAASRSHAADEWLRKDIFEKAGVAPNKDGDLHPQLFLLNQQRRMHPDISAFTNNYIYHSLVEDHESVRENREQAAGLAPFPGKASVLVDTSYTGEHSISARLSNSRLNPWHLFQAFQVIHESYEAGSRSIGYVTPYRAQADLMGILLDDLYKEEKAQGNLASATVHRFQGSEREVMVFDSVDSYPFPRPGMLLTGKDSSRLINVAITRSKSKFIHISDMNYIRSHVYPSKTIRQLVDYQASGHQAVHPGEIGTWVKNHHPRLGWFHAKNLERVRQDLAGAQSSILISLPEGMVLTKDWQEMVNRTKVKKTVISGGMAAGVKADEKLSGELPFPFIMIDQKYLWYGMPFENIKNTRPPSVAVRLESKTFIEAFLRMLPVTE